MGGRKFTLLFLVIAARCLAQTDVIKVVKQDQGAVLFASVANQIVSAKVTREQAQDIHRLYVNDSIAIFSYWFICHSGGAQHMRQEMGELFSTQTYWDITHLGKGGSAYFTEIVGYCVYSKALYRIYDLEINITD